MEKIFGKQILDRLDKIIELLEKDKKPKKRLLEDTFQGNIEIKDREE